MTIAQQTDLQSNQIIPIGIDTETIMTESRCDRLGGRWRPKTRRRRIERRRSRNGRHDSRSSTWQHPILHMLSASWTREKLIIEAANAVPENQNAAVHPPPHIRFHRLPGRIRHSLVLSKNFVCVIGEDDDDVILMASVKDKWRLCVLN